MPVQRFAPMTKRFPSFDCDAHVAEPPWIWDRAKEWLTSDEFGALKQSIWYDSEARSLIVNGRAGAGIGAGCGAQALVRERATDESSRSNYSERFESNARRPPSANAAVDRF